MLQMKMMKQFSYKLTFVSMFSTIRWVLKEWKVMTNFQSMIFIWRMENVWHHKVQWWRHQTDLWEQNLFHRLELWTASSHSTKVSKYKQNISIYKKGVLHQMFIFLLTFLFTFLHIAGARKRKMNLSKRIQKLALKFRNLRKNIA